MSRTPHVYVPAPWPDDVIALPAETQHHLGTVLRLGTGARLSYTDGEGTVGSGSLDAEGLVRGDEEIVARPGATITVAVAAPGRSGRARFVVEKLAEIGVDRLIWLDAERIEGRPPLQAKATAWAAAALEQSRGAFLLEISGPVKPAALAGPVFAAVLGGRAYAGGAGDATLLVGPEGGWVEGELPETSIPVHLGGRTLRTETAAIVFATLALDRAGRLAVPAKKT